MRIRKGGKFSAEIASQCMENQPSKAYVCEVNRSPWDVIPFSQENINFSLNFQSQRKFRSDEIESFITTESAIKRLENRSPVEAEEGVICLGPTNNANEDKIIRESNDFNLNSPLTNDELPTLYLRKDNNKRILFGRSSDRTIWDYSRLGSGGHPKGTRISEGEGEADQVPDGPRVVEPESAKAEDEVTSSRRARAKKRAIKDEDYYCYSGFEFESNRGKIGESERSE